MYDQGSTIGSNSSKISPTVYTPRPGIDTNMLNTKSYNSLMKMLLNKEQEIYKMTGVMNIGTSVKHNLSTSKANGGDSKKNMRGQDFNNFRQSEIVAQAGLKNSAKDIEEYLKLNTGSRNYLAQTSSNLSKQNR